MFSCSHAACLDCMKSYLNKPNIKIYAPFFIKCPFPGCFQALTNAEINSFQISMNLKQSIKPTVFYKWTKNIQ